MSLKTNFQITSQFHVFDIMKQTWQPSELTYEGWLSSGGAGLEVELLLLHIQKEQIEVHYCLCTQVSTH